MTQVQMGEIWLTSKQYYVLVMTPLTDAVFNIAMWPAAEGMEVIPGPSAQGSMIAGDVLAYDACRVRESDPEIVAVIEAAVSGHDSSD